MTNRLNGLFICFLILPLHVEGQGGLERQEANMGPGCRVAISFPIGLNAGIGGEPNIGLPWDSNAGAGGFSIDSIPKSWNTSLDRLSINLICENMDSESFGYLVRFNPETGQWEKNFDYLSGIFNHNTNDEEYRAYVSAIQVVNVTAVNSAGYVMTQDQIMGVDEEWRQRHLVFCLQHPPKVLCGNGWVANLRELPRGDLTPHIIEIMRSIEFLPDAPTGQSPDQP